MAKVSPVSIKYMVYASFRAEGPLEKPDVIGAIFGQTEGLLGNDLEMRELQKEGKIGRIEVNLELVDGKSVGEIQLPSALDKSETTIIAAALETIDRIGPTEAEIKIKKIEDVRGSKRDYIVERAKALLSGLDDHKEFGEMSRTVTEESRALRIQEYGDEKLPAGDLSGNEIIVVEGRADVVNLLRNRVNNVIGMNGTKLPREIAKLGESKEITLFVDGDRGGKLIANNVMSNARIRYVAIAPDGKEVEELTGKEILLSLRRRFSAEEYGRRLGNGSSYVSSADDEEEETPSVKIEITSEVKEKLRSLFEKIRGSKNALIIDENYDIVMKVSAREVSRTLKNVNGKIFAVLVDGSATGTLISTLEERGASVLGATNFTSYHSNKVHLLSL